MEQKNTSSSNNMISNQNDDNKNNGSKTEINKGDNQKNEIDILKKEIADLKNKSQQDQKTISEFKLLFTTEIKKLQEQIKNLSEEIKSLKSKKKKKDDNNINNIDNIDNDDINMEESDEENIELDDNKYSLVCLSRRLKTDISQGTDKANMEIVVKNNSKIKFPNNSQLICDIKRSLLLCDNVDLGKLEPNEQKIIRLQFNNLKHISKGEYKCFVKLKVENKIYSSSVIELIINVVPPRNVGNNPQNNFNFNQNPPLFNNNINNINNIINPILQNNNNNLVSTFREQFQLFDYDNIPDERIQNALMVNNNDFNKAFESLYN